MKIGIIIQARMGSTRLPGKSLKEVLGRPLLAYLIDRLKRVKGSPPIILATTTKAADNVLINYASGMEIDSFRGSEDNVLERFYLAAKARHLDVIVRVTADCPLIDPAVIDQTIKTYVENYPKIDYVSNTLTRTYPRGMDVEVFSFRALERAYREATQKDELEHVTPYIYRHPEIFALKGVEFGTDQSQHRWTVDTPEDFELIRRLIEALYPKNPHFSLGDLLKQMESHPEWAAINSHIQQKKP
jgi:spore coat polysaccharide biosynthesis protein SpsF